jgi:hypothetical protein
VRRVLRCRGLKLSYLLLQQQGLIGSRIGILPREYRRGG